MPHQYSPSHAANHPGGVLQQFLPALLCGCYLMALMLPSPGQWLNTWEFPAAVPEVLNPRLPHLLVAMLLFLASLGAQLQRLPLVLARPLVLGLALVAVWLVPALLIIPVGWILPTVIPAAEVAPLVIGFALVAAMPVANSAAGWTQQSRGELPWTLILVVLSILVCPVVTPLVLWLLGLTFTAAEGRGLAELMSHFTGLKFVIWVLLPTAMGIFLRRLVGPGRVAHYRGQVLMASAAILLLLNYINASVALPSMQSQIQLAGLGMLALAAFLTCLAGLGTARLLGWATGCSPQVKVALDYALMMKNTGLALALANDILATQPLVVLPLFAATLIQHLVAGWHHARLQRHSLEGQMEGPAEA